MRRRNGILSSPGLPRRFPPPPERPPPRDSISSSLAQPAGAPSEFSLLHHADDTGQYLEAALPHAAGPFPAALRERALDLHLGALGQSARRFVTEHHHGNRALGNGGIARARRHMQAELEDRGAGRR